MCCVGLCTELVACDVSLSTQIQKWTLYNLLSQFLLKSVISGLTAAGAVLDLVVDKLGDEDHVCEDVEHSCDYLKDRVQTNVWNDSLLYCGFPGYQGSTGNIGDDCKDIYMHIKGSILLRWTQ